MRRVKPFLLILSTLFGLQGLMPIAQAHEARTGQIHGLLGPYLYRTNFTGVKGYGESPFLGGGGLQVQGDIDQNGSLEIAIFYTQDLYKRHFEGETAIEQTKRVRISTGYRYWLKRELGLAALFYSAYAIGGPELVHRSSQAADFLDTSARDVTEYGFDFSVQWEFWRWSSLAAALDGRYSMSLTEKDYEKGDQYGLFLALKFQVQQSSLRPE